MSLSQSMISSVQRKVFRAGSLLRTLIRLLSSFNQLSIRNYKNRGWHLKKKISKKISSEYIDSYYNKALKAGAIGGKLLGAGGGGFLLIYCPLKKQDNVRNALKGLFELKFNFDYEGSKVIYIGESNWDDGFFE